MLDLTCYSKPHTNKQSTKFTDILSQPHLLSQAIDLLLPATCILSYKYHLKSTQHYEESFEHSAVFVTLPYLPCFCSDCIHCCCTSLTC